MKVQLIVVQGKQRGKCLHFPHGEFVFGRGQECHVRPNSELVSRQHCLLKIDDESVIVRDLGSTNGTLVNGHIVCGEQALLQGDRLQVGPVVLQVQFMPNGVETIAETSIYATNETMPDFRLISE